MSIIEVIGLLAGSTLLSSLVVGIFERRKKAADAADVLTRIALNMVEPLNAKVIQLEAEIEKLKKGILELEKSLILKDVRIRELETKAVIKDLRILELEREVGELKRKISVLEESR